MNVIPKKTHSGCIEQTKKEKKYSEWYKNHEKNDEEKKESWQEQV